MKRLLMMFLALIVPGLLCGCGAGPPASPAAAPAKAASTRPAPASPAVPSAKAASTRLAPALADVEAFYRQYAGARQRGRAAVSALIGAYVARWYAPILAAPGGAGPGPGGCGIRTPVTEWTFRQVAAAGGQAVIVIGTQPRSAPQQLWIVAIAAPESGRITGITCSIGGGNVTPAGARDAAAALLSFYRATRQRGASTPDAISRLLGGGPESGSQYLLQVQYAVTRHQLAYDPVTCAAAGVPDLAPGTATIVAGGSAGLVTASTRNGQALVITVIRGAKGWTAGDIACGQR